MAKGKPTPKIAKGTNGRKNHGPKRHLHHDIGPKAFRQMMGTTGLLNKYHNFESFCLAMQARGVRADMEVMWAEFRRIPYIERADGSLGPNRAAEKEFFKNAAELGAKLMKKKPAASASKK